MDYLPDFISKAKRKVKDVLSFNIYVKPIVKVKIAIKGRENHGLNPKIYKVYMKELLKEIYRITNVRRKQINIDYHPTNKKKTFPKKSEQNYLGVENVNSGVTLGNTKENETNIIIYRKEEFYKVLTHEMLHLYDVIPYERELENKIKAMYPKLFNTINLNEAFVELNAMLINIKIISKLTSKNTKQMLEKECNWSKSRYERILEFYDIGSVDKINEKFDERGTHVFSYYLLKWFYFNEIGCINMKRKDIKNKNRLRMTINDIENYKL